MAIEIRLKAFTTYSLHLLMGEARLWQSLYPLAGIQRIPYVRIPYVRCTSELWASARLWQRRYPLVGIPLGTLLVTT